LLPRILISVTLASMIAACGSSGSATAPTNDSTSLSAQVTATPAIAFTPNKVSVAVGGSVTFAFGTVGHNVYFDNDPAGAPASIAGVNANASVTRTFPTAGVYNYFCHIHPGMSGSVVVGGAADAVMPTDTTGYGSGSGYNRKP
jgi:plastocyanin